MTLAVLKTNQIRALNTNKNTSGRNMGWVGLLKARTSKINKILAIIA